MMRGWAMDDRMRLCARDLRHATPSTTQLSPGAALGLTSRLTCGSSRGLVSEWTGTREGASRWT